ncbi:nucleotidyltransferase domain-containing protein [Chloroflexi bacterium TSY]|nr:nucleotidyltransferase domain-containing protein [Chloroflexi bacterium TSY]
MNQSPTPSSIQKRQQLVDFTERYLKPEAAIQAVIAVGSIATGTARPDSDIDAILFLDPLDYYIVPSESVWMPETGTFHSIFDKDADSQYGGIQFDFMRFDLEQWSDPNYEGWTDGQRAGLTSSWMVYDRKGVVSELVQEQTAFPDALRQARLDEALVGYDQNFRWSTAEERWEHHGPIEAHDRLNDAYRHLISALFTYNRQWIPWRNRETQYLLRLPWLPERFEERLLSALTASGHDLSAYLERFKILNALFDEVIERLSLEGLYGDDPVGEAFVRSHDEPGFAWNMDEWNEKHSARL